MLTRPDLNCINVKKIIIPPRPEAMVKIAQEASSADPDLSVVAKVLSTDVGLSGALLQVVNSPFYGLKRKITSVSQASGLLGIKKVDKLVTSVAVRAQLGAKLNLNQFWERATSLANLAGLLAKRLVGIDADEAYMLGLFHDCGIPIMMQQYQDFNDTLQQCSSTTVRPVTVIEIEKYGFHHAMVGFMLAKEWFLSTAMCDAILFHHDCLEIFQGDLEKDGEVISLIAVLKLAEQLNYEIRQGVGAEQCEDWEKIGPIITEYLNLSQEDFDEMKDDFKEQLQESQM